jgi:transcription initiation factor IIE alpha subunit
MKKPYGGLPPFQKHSATSKMAALAIERKIGPLHCRVLDLLVTGNFTDEQMMDELELPGNTLRPRRRELELKGLVVNTKTHDFTKSGRKAVLWGLSDTTRELMSCS